MAVFEGAFGECFALGVDGAVEGGSGEGDDGRLAGGEDGGSGRAAGAAARSRSEQAATEIAATRARRECRREGARRLGRLVLPAGGDSALVARRAPGDLAWAGIGDLAGAAGPFPNPRNSSDRDPDTWLHDHARLDDAPGTLRISVSSTLPLAPPRAAVCVLDLLGQARPQSYVAVKPGVQLGKGWFLDINRRLLSNKCCTHRSLRRRITFRLLARSSLRAFAAVGSCANALETLNLSTRDFVASTGEVIAGLTTGDSAAGVDGDGGRLSPTPGYGARSGECGGC